MSGVVVVDYGIGNVASVFNALKRVGCEAKIVSTGVELAALDPSKIILPGVGAIGRAMANLAERRLIEPLNELVIARQRPFLGICVGMQVLTDHGEEFGQHACLGWIPGATSILAEPEKGIRLPHVGWNTIESKEANGLFAGLPEYHFYFCHSYGVRCDDADVIARCDYHGPFVAAIRRGNIHGVQFHPEKSSRAGEALLGNFIAMAATSC